MTNIDLQLRLQNTAVLNRIEALTQRVSNVRLNIQATGLQALRTRIGNYLQQHPISINVTFNRASLRNASNQIAQHPFPVHLTVANPGQFVAQIRQLIAHAGGGGGGGFGVNIFPRGLLGPITGGSFLGVSASTVATQSISAVFGAIADGLRDITQAGLDFQRNVIGISSTFALTSKVIDRGTGQEVGLERSLPFLNRRAKGLLKTATPELASLGISPGTTATALRTIITGAASSGLDITDKDILQFNKSLLAKVAITDPRLLNEPVKLQTGIEGLLEGQQGAERTEVGRALGSAQSRKIKEAVQTGDIEKVREAFKGLAEAAAVLAKNVDFAVLPLNKIGAVFSMLALSGGDTFLNKITPSLAALAKALTDAEFLSSLNSFAERVGEFTSKVIDFTTKLIQGLNPDQLVASAAKIDNFLNALVPKFGLMLGQFFSNIGFEAVRFVMNGAGIPFAGDLLKNVPAFKSANEQLNKGQEFSNEFFSDQFQKFDSGALQPVNAGFQGAGASLLGNFAPTAPKTLDKADRVRFRTQLDQQVAEGLMTPEGRIKALQGLNASLQKDRADWLSDSKLKKVNLPKEITPEDLLKNAERDNDEQTFRGRSEIGRAELTKRFLKTEKLPDITNRQIENLETNIQGEELQAKDALAKTFRELPVTVANASLKFTELTSSIEANKMALDDLTTKQRIASLEGANKVSALVQQITASGGTVSADQLGKIQEKFGKSDMPGLGGGELVLEGILGAGVPKEFRERALASANLDTFLNTFNPANDAKGQKAGLQQQGNNLNFQQGELKFDVQAAQTNAALQAIQLAQKLTPEELKDPANRTIAEGAAQGKRLFNNRSSGLDAQLSPEAFKTAFPDLAAISPGLTPGGANQTQNDVFQSMVGHLATIAANTTAIAANTAPLLTLGSN